MRLTKIFETVVIDAAGDGVIVDGTSYDAKVGKHSIWVPDLCMKFPFHYNGHFVEYKDWDKGQHADAILDHSFGVETPYSTDSLANIVEENIIFSLFAERDFAPKVSSFFFYIKNLISLFPYGAWHCDPKGAYGFFMEDAEKLSKKPEGFDEEAFRKSFIDTKLLKCSETALGDILEPGRRNHIRGRIIDIRRSIQDAVHLRVNDDGYQNLVTMAKNIVYREDKASLQLRVLHYGQFPFGERQKPYQSYWLGDEYVKGSRDVKYRFGRMQLPLDMTGTTVLDLGCQLGVVAQACYRRGARKIVGLDHQPEFVECARDLARYNGNQISFLEMDLKYGTRSVIKYVNEYFRSPIGVVFALAIYKHIGDSLWEILDGIRFKTLYVESSSCKDENTSHVVEVTRQLKERYKTEFLGFVEDRSKRAIWKCTNEKEI